MRRTIGGQRYLCQINGQLRAARLLNRFGGFSRVGDWFKRFRLVLEQVKSPMRENTELSDEISQLEEKFEDRVDSAVAAEVLQYKQAYKNKSREVELLRRYEPKSPSPRGP
jgi:hypothetical protein